MRDCSTGAASARARRSDACSQASSRSASPTRCCTRPGSIPRRRRHSSRAPLASAKSETRLPYFARYLEHAEPLIAEDAYLEFGHAPYDEVRAVAKHLPMAEIRRWVVDPNIPQFRKGFYGLALGLATNKADREANTAVLRKIIDSPESDFRQGFDGAIGGYLIAVTSLGLPSQGYISQTVQWLFVSDVMSGLVKSVVFALIIGFVGVYRGLNVRGGPAGVGLATTSSVVTSILLCIVATAIITAILYAAK